MFIVMRFKTQVIGYGALFAIFISEKPCMKLFALLPALLFSTFAIAQAPKKPATPAKTKPVVKTNLQKILDHTLVQAIDKTHDAYTNTFAAHGIDLKTNNYGQTIGNTYYNANTPIDEKKAQSMSYTQLNGHFRIIQKNGIYPILFIRPLSLCLLACSGALVLMSIPNFLASPILFFVEGYIMSVLNMLAILLKMIATPILKNMKF
ncbi:MAG: hypothetical protein M0D57_18865 [Sphingobacteriales bacterium JAD_PAG50586_3]|nr:MAG: hypothetical protein M0D57_18865 [Sphingobacteriales bacterium JAD_PAG50586_3]